MRRDGTPAKGGQIKDASLEAEKEMMCKGILVSHDRDDQMRCHVELRGTRCTGSDGSECTRC